MMYGICVVLLQVVREVGRERTEGVSSGEVSVSVVGEKIGVRGEKVGVIVFRLIVIGVGVVGEKVDTKGVKVDGLGGFILVGVAVVGSENYRKL